MWPLCETITFCTMARPRPVPAALVVANGWNALLNASGVEAGAVVFEHHREVAVG